MTLPKEQTLDSLINAIANKFSKGPTAWDWSGDDFSYMTLKMDGRYLSAGEVCQLSVNSKRNKEYELAARAYITLLTQIAYPSISVLTSLFKYLCTINEYYFAYQLITTICADAQVARGVNPSYKTQLQQMFNVFHVVINKAYNSRNADYMIDFTTGYSGQSFYCPIVSKDVILQHVDAIMNILKKRFGNDTCRYINF